MTDQLNLFADTQTKPKPKPAVFKGTLIYVPKGRAREYATLACNIYRGCDHQCVYCYAPSATQRSREDFVQSSPRSGFLTKLEKEAAKLGAIGTDERILLCFTCDPYQRLDSETWTTRRTIEILHHNGLYVQILTKGGSRALRDLDLFTSKDTFATTLTFLYSGPSLDWEPYAAEPHDRIDTIKQFHAAGIPTWVSLEPVLDPEAALEIIRKTWDFVDLFKVGKLNYHPLAQSIDWHRFVQEAIQLLTSLGYRRNTDPDSLQSGQFYIKRDLARYI